MLGVILKTGFLLPGLLALLHFHTMGQTTVVSDDHIAERWVDSVYGSLSLRQRLAQTLMIRTYSNKTREYYDQVEQLIREHHIGGLCFFQGGPVSQAKLVNRYQKAASTPLFVAQDAEWGLGMRIDSAFSFPLNMTLGAIQDHSIVYRIAAEIAGHLKSVGVHINFAPVVDVNSNPANPVINSRSFGQHKELVASHGIAYMNGLQDNGIIATAKHFPGHGDTDTDSHYTLPVIRHSAARMDSIEIYPFRELIEQGVKAIMTAHLYIPSLDSSEEKASTLSSVIVGDILRDKLGFKGLMITDALDMKGVAGRKREGEIEVEAFLAGNDILLLPQNVVMALDALEKAMMEGTIREQDLEHKCKKILRYKFESGLADFTPLDVGQVTGMLNNVQNELLERAAYRNAITLIKNDNRIIPVPSGNRSGIATLCIGSPQVNAFQDMLDQYTDVTHYNAFRDIDAVKAGMLADKLEHYGLVIIGIHNTSMFPQKKFGITASAIALAMEIASRTNVVLNIFGSPYAYTLFEDLALFKALICSYQDTKISQEISAQMISGALGFQGCLPVEIPGVFKAGTGLLTIQTGKLIYSIPEEAGIDRTSLMRIDSIAHDCIAKKATPGCQVFVAVNGLVVYDKSFGYHTYDKGNFVRHDDLYDLASLTKILATTLCVMKLGDENKMDIDERLVKYLPSVKQSDKENIVLREMMAHQAGFTPWIPFHQKLTVNKNPDPAFFHKNIEEGFTVKVASNLYLRDDYPYFIIDTILKSPLSKKRQYQYSDLGFYLLARAIDNITNQPFDKYFTQSFIKPLGLNTMTFHPLHRFSPDRIAPTENDRVFRKQLIHGYVHDQGAALLGGVSGHAGLFSNAKDVAVIMQMLLQKGYYGGKQYLKPSTVEEFTRQQFPLDKNRRGIGFDKPELYNGKNGPACKHASASSFGHTGFTGTYAWADPEYGIVYIFLSNRVYPDASVNKLARLNVRTEIQAVIYEAMKDKLLPD